VNGKRFSSARNTSGGNHLLGPITSVAVKVVTEL
jgi:hypothetical protein